MTSCTHTTTEAAAALSKQCSCLNSVLKCPALIEPEPNLGGIHDEPLLSQYRLHSNVANSRIVYKTFAWK